MSRLQSRRAWREGSSRQCPGCPKTFPNPTCTAFFRSSPLSTGRARLMEAWEITTWLLLGEPWSQVGETQPCVTLGHSPVSPNLQLHLTEQGSGLSSVAKTMCPCRALPLAKCPPHPLPSTCNCKTLLTTRGCFCVSEHVVLIRVSWQEVLCEEGLRGLPQRHPGTWGGRVKVSETDCQ